jgi:hypothetical protein
MSRPIIIVGAGRLGRNIAEIFDGCRKAAPLAKYLDDTKKRRRPNPHPSGVGWVRVGAGSTLRQRSFMDSRHRRPSDPQRTLPGLGERRRHSRQRHPSDRPDLQDRRDWPRYLFGDLFECGAKRHSGGWGDRGGPFPPGSGCSGRQGCVHRTWIDTDGGSRRWDRAVSLGQRPLSPTTLLLGATVWWAQIR